MLLLYLENHVDNADPALVGLLLDAGIDPSEEDVSGSSALRAAFMETSNDSNTKTIKEMLAAASDRKKSAEIKAEINRKNREDYAETVPFRLSRSSLLLLPLAYTGLSIWMREGVYRDNPLSNWMGTVNAFTTGFAGTGLTGGAVLAFLIVWAGFSEQKSLSLDEATSLFFGIMVACPIIGLISGIVLAALPVPRDAFKENPFLYYLPSAALGAGAGVVLWKIWLD
jgi:hypothetical protein